MSKNTIFGEENFIDKKMVAMSENIEIALIDDIYKTTLQIRFDINKQKLERWLRFCAKLENIEQTELIDMATKKKIADLKHELDQLKQQLAEKQNEIDEINKEFVQAVHDWKALCAEKDKEIANLQVLIIENKNDIKEMREFKIGDDEYDLTDEDARNDIKCQIENQTQLAIQELEKVKDWLNEPFDEDGCFKNGGDLIGFIDQQIKELKGEKDVED